MRAFDERKNSSGALPAGEITKALSEGAIGSAELGAGYALLLKTLIDTVQLELKVAKAALDVGTGLAARDYVKMSRGQAEALSAAGEAFVGMGKVITAGSLIFSGMARWGIAVDEATGVRDRVSGSLRNIAAEAKEGLHARMEAIRRRFSKAPNKVDLDDLLRQSRESQEIAPAGYFENQLMSLMAKSPSLLNQQPWSTLVEAGTDILLPFRTAPLWRESIVSWLMFLGNSAETAQILNQNRELTVAERLKMLDSLYEIVDEAVTQAVGGDSRVFQQLPEIWKTSGQAERMLILGAATDSLFDRKS